MSFRPYRQCKGRHSFQNRYSFRTKPFHTMHFFSDCDAQEALPAFSVTLPHPLCHVERSEAESKHPTMRAHALREILRLRPAGSAQDDRKRTLPYPPCHVERSEAKSKHLTMRTHAFREILRLRPAGSAQDDRKRTLSYPLYHVTPLPLSCYPTLPVMLSGAKRSRNIPL